MDEDGFGFSITVVGLGMIGGSFAMALKEKTKHKVYGIDIDKYTMRKALDMGIIENGDKSYKEILKDSDIVVIALYPKETIRFIESNLSSFKAGAILTDVSGVKRCIIKELDSILPNNLEYVAGHPMVGNEFEGIDNACVDMFVGANYFITPHIKNSKENLETIEKIVSSIGCKHVIRLDSKVHDDITSFMSHLPHLIAVSLMNSRCWDGDKSAFAGKSIKDMTRIAGLNKKLWEQIFYLNSDNIIQKLEEFENNLGYIKACIKLKNTVKLEKIFDNSIRRKKEIIS